MKQISRLILILYVLVITDPYKGIKYNDVNVYETNYCSNYCYNYKDDWGESEDDEVEELEDELRDEYGEEKPAPLSLDFWTPKK